MDSSLWPGPPTMRVGSGAMVEYEGDTSTELERRLGPLKIVSLVEVAMWVAAAAFWLLGSRPAQLLLWSLHGMVVVAFAGMVLLIYRSLGWSLRFAALAILTGPVGAVMVFARLRREEPAIHQREQAALRARAAGVRSAATRAGGASPAGAP
jgi:hypothetical protein